MNMRTLALVLAGSLAALFGFSSSAGATPTVDLVWASTTSTDPGTVAGLGTSAIVAAPGDHIGMEIYLTAGTEGIRAYGISIAFDTDVKVLHTPTEYGTAAASFPCSPFPVCFTGPRPNLQPLGAGVNGWDTGTPGFVYTFESATLSASNYAYDTFGPMKIGEIWFEVQPAVATDGIDITSGFFNPGVDAILDAANNSIGAVFGDARVDAFAPEPGTATLLGLGLLGLTLAGRRNRK
jgi:hypothetical protein